MNILLDYFFKVTSIEPTPAASTAFLKQACVVVKPKNLVDPGEFTECTTAAQIAALTDNVDAQQMLLAGMSKVTILTAEDLEIGSLVANKDTDFYTLVISSDFNKDDVTDEDADFSAFKGVIAVCENDKVFLASQAAIKNRIAFYKSGTVAGRNMCFAIGKLLANSLAWRNQQYISMPFVDDVDTLGEAESLFEDKISFVISDSEFGERLALLAAGGKAVTAPYIKRNFEIDLQSAALSYVSGNQPAYTLTQAALLEDELQKVAQAYIDSQRIEAATVSVTLEQENFVASGNINIAEPKALWRIFAEMRQTL
jgi:hypothetical protein